MRPGNVYVPTHLPKRRTFELLSHSGEKLGQVEIDTHDGVVHEREDGTLIVRGAGVSRLDKTHTRSYSTTKYHAVILPPTGPPQESLSASESAVSPSAEDHSEEATVHVNVEKVDDGAAAAEEEDSNWGWVDLGGRGEERNDDWELVGGASTEPSDGKS
jgi:hypothetical protein